MPGSNGDNGSLALTVPDFSDPWGSQYPQVSGGVPGSSSNIGSIIAAGIDAAGRIGSSLITSRSQADLMKYSTVGSPGFFYAAPGQPGQPSSFASIGSSTLILTAVAVILVLFLFTRRSG